MPREVPFSISAPHRLALQACGLTSLEACLTFTRGEMVKAALPGRQTLRFEAAGELYYLKRIKGQGVRDIQNEAQALELLFAQHLPVPEPVAFGMAWRQGVLITRALPAQISLERILLDQQPDSERIERLASRLADLVRNLHALGVNHRDLYAGHVLVDADDKLYLVDLGRAETRTRVPRRRVVKDLAALHFSLPSRHGGDDLLAAFLENYLADAGGPRGSARLTAAVERKAQRMRRHARHKLRRGEPNIHLNE